LIRVARLEEEEEGEEGEELPTQHAAAAAPRMVSGGTWWATATCGFHLNGFSSKHIFLAGGWMGR
jgi:hypothetical protein